MSNDEQEEFNLLAARLAALRAKLDFPKLRAAQYCGGLLLSTIGAASAYELPLSVSPSGFTLWPIIVATLAARTYFGVRGAVAAAALGSLALPCLAFRAISPVNGLADVLWYPGWLVVVWWIVGFSESRGMPRGYRLLKLFQGSLVDRAPSASPPVEKNVRFRNGCSIIDVAVGRPAQARFRCVDREA